MKKFYSLFCFSLCLLLLLAEASARPMMAPGESCEMAVVAEAGSGFVPAVTVEYYWYTFTMPREGKLIVSSAVENYVYVSSGTCDNDYWEGDGSGNASAVGLSAGEQVYIRWSAYNEGNFSWNLAVEDYVEGDMCSLAAPAVEGENTVPATNVEYYWYTFTMPREGKLIVSSAGQNYIYVSSGTCDNYYRKGDGYGNASAVELSAGEQVNIRWSAYNEGNFSWNLAVEDYVAGDDCSLAATAVEGTNSTPSAPYWYSFTMPQDGNLKISSYGTATTDTYLEVYSSCLAGDLIDWNDDSYDSYQSELTIDDVQAGEVFYIKWGNDYSSSGFDWTLTVDPSIQEKTGDDCSLAATAVEGTNSTPSAPYWYSFTMPQDGNLKISSYGTATTDTYLKVYSSCLESDLVDSNDDTYDSFQSELTIDGIQAGEVFYIKWDNDYSSSGFDWTITVESSIIEKSSQSISFATISAKALSVASIPLEATASSGLAIRYEVTSGPATVSESTLRFIGAGSVTIAAHQDGNENYEAAESVSQRFCIKPNKPFISLATGEEAVIGATLESNSASGNQWYKDGTLLEGATAESYTTTEAGLYTVQIAAGECRSQKSEGVQIVEITGIYEVKTKEPLNLYPNPTSDIVNVGFTSNKRIEDISVYVMDVNGRRINLTSSIEGHREKKNLKIDLRDLAAGFYYIIINDGEKLTKAKVFKK